MTEHSPAPDAARIRQESEAMTEDKALEDSIRGF